MSTVERTQKYATTVDSLTQAFEFVMAHVDVVGDAPSVVITPFWSYGDGDDGVRCFEVAVSGMVEDGVA